MKYQKTLSAAFALAAALFICAGCAEGPGFPSMSLAKFVRAPCGDDDAGAVGFSTGVAIVEQYDMTGDESDDFASSFYFFPAEGALSFWLAENYDLSLSVNMNALAFLEGSLGADLGGVRVAFLHGVGLGIWGEATGYEDDWAGSLPYAFSAGLLIQTTLWKSGALFLGVRYTYSSAEGLGEAADSETDEWAHYATGSLGYTFTTGALRITPEFILSYGHRYRSDPDDSTYDDGAWMILPTINIAASF